MNNYVNWDEVPEVMSKETFYKVCHIAKRTARELLQSGKVKCEYNERTGRYTIRKSDVMEYMAVRTVFSTRYYEINSRKRKINLSYPKAIPDRILKQLHKYYRDLFADALDELTARDVSDLIGYHKYTILKWCGNGLFEHACAQGDDYVIPKTDLIDFLCSRRAQAIVTKSKWHIEAIYSFETGR